MGTQTKCSKYAHSQNLVPCGVHVPWLRETLVFTLNGLEGMGGNIDIHI